MRFFPMALFVYRRPLHTKRLIESLKRNPEAAVMPLFIFSDAPKGMEDVADVTAVRAYLHTLTGFGRITLTEHSVHQGLAQSIIQGVTALSEQYGAVIVLEDDLILSSHFLAYMQAGLIKYEHEPKVFQIAGHMFDVIGLDPSLRWGDGQEACFLPMISSWGWGTWARAWKTFDPTAAGFSVLKNSWRQRFEFDLKGTSTFYKMLQYQQWGKNQSWAIRWYLSVFLQQGLTLFPLKTLVVNGGFDGSGEHCHDQAFLQPLDEAFTVRTFPDKIEVNQAIYGAVRRYYRKNRTYRAAVRHWVELLL